MSKPPSIANPDSQQRKQFILQPPPMVTESQLMNQQMAGFVPIIPGSMLPSEAPTQEGLPMFSIVPMDNGANCTLKHTSQVPGFVSYGYQQPDMGMMLPPGMILMPTTGPVSQQANPQECNVLGPRYSAPCVVPVSFLPNGVVFGHHQQKNSHPDMLHAEMLGPSVSKSFQSETMMPEQRRHSTSDAGKSAKNAVKNPTRYKTEMCRNWVEKGKCRYGSKCQFAHGTTDLRQVSRHPRYKTELCKSYHLTGACPYGSRCRFIHALNQPEQTDDSIDASLLFKLSDLLGDQQAESLPGFSNEVITLQESRSIPETEELHRIRPTSVSAPEQRSIQEEMESLIGTGLLFESGVEIRSNQANRDKRSNSIGTESTTVPGITPFASVDSTLGGRNVSMTSLKLPQAASMGSFTSTDDAQSPRLAELASVCHPGAERI